MKQPKTVYLVFALLGLVVIIMLVQIVKFSEKPNSEPNRQAAPSVAQFTSSPKFQILSTSLTNEPVKVNQPVVITFNQPVNNQKLALEISPKVEILPLFSSDLTELTIKPLNVWSFDTHYTIKVLQSTQAQDNQFLDKDYEFSFQTQVYIGI